jgi:TRAP-type C4-dicarboxylate transport system permease small subunit
MSGPAQHIPELAEAAGHDLAAPAEPRRDVRILLGLASVLLAVAVLVVLMQIILRFGFNNPRAWAEEVSRYLFIWMVFIGCGIATARGSHIRVTEIVDMFGDGGRRWSLRLGFAADLVCNLVLIYTGTLIAWKNRFAEFYSLSGVPLVIFYVALPVGGALMLIYQFRSRPAGLTHGLG